MKRQATEGKKIFAKGLAFKISKELLKLNNTRNNKKKKNKNKRNNPIKKTGNVPGQIPQRSIQWNIISDKEMRSEATKGHGSILNAYCVEESSLKELHTG